MKYKLSDREELVLSEFWKNNEVLTTMAVSYTHLDVYKRQVM